MPRDDTWRESCLSGGRVETDANNGRHKRWIANRRERGWGREIQSAPSIVSYDLPAVIVSYVAANFYNYNADVSRILRPPTSSLFLSVSQLPLGHFTDCFMLAQRAAFPRECYLAAFIESSIITSSRGQLETDSSCEIILLVPVDYFAAFPHDGYVFRETVILSSRRENPSLL